MPTDKEIEAAMTKIRDGWVQMSCGVISFEEALPIMAKAALEAAEKCRSSEATSKREDKLREMFMGRRLLAKVRKAIKEDIANYGNDTERLPWVLSKTAFNVIKQALEQTEEKTDA